MANHKIKLKKQTPPTTDPYGKEIKKADKDTVEWEPEKSGDKDWAVVFDGPTPFERHVYNADHPKTKDIVVDPSETHYHYSVCMDGKRSHSPWIIVR